MLETEVKANLTLECQTSFEPIDYAVDSKITYCTVVKEDQIEGVSEDYEAILIEDGLIDMKKVIEDELILSVPIAANKPTGELTQKMSYGELDEEAIAQEEAASRAVVQYLRHTKLGSEGWETGERLLNRVPNLPSLQSITWLAQNSTSEVHGYRLE